MPITRAKAKIARAGIATTADHADHAPEGPVARVVQADHAPAATAVDQVQAPARKERVRVAREDLAQVGVAAQEALGDGAMTAATTAVMTIARPAKHRARRPPR